MGSSTTLVTFLLYVYTPSVSCNPLVSYSSLATSQPQLALLNSSALGTTSPNRTLSSVIDGEVTAFGPAVILSTISYATVTLTTPAQEELVLSKWVERIGTM